MLDLVTGSTYISTMSRKGGGRTGPPSQIPRGSPAGRVTSSSQNLRSQTVLAHSAEDIPKQLSSNAASAKGDAQSAGGSRRAPSPVDSRRGPMAPQAGNAQHPGIRYITEDLIRKIAKEDNLGLITSLNLTLAGDKKIKYIEGLDKLSKLQILNLGFNIIERIEHLDKFTHLQELNLASNMLTKLDGLENLTSLQSLNVSDNQIKLIPPWFAKKLKALRTFRIARNCVSSLSEVPKLKSLSDLTQIDVTGNPMCDISHCRLYIVFHLRTVEVLDGKSVLDQEREQAQNRFALDEVKQLEKKLEQMEHKYQQLEMSHDKSLQEKSLQESSHMKLMSKEKNLQTRLTEMEKKLSEKDDLLAKKTSALNRANQKYYELEQSLAFNNIDSKFQLEAPQFPVENVDDSGDLKESPYIGRAHFKANKFAFESNIVEGAQQVPQVHSIKSSAGVIHTSLATPSKGKLSSDLDQDLEEKQAEVERTEEKLKALKVDLSITEDRLANATKELRKISVEKVPNESVREDKIGQRLTRKMKKVKELKDEAVLVQTEIDRKNEKIMADRAELRKIKSHLAEMDNNNLGYEKKQREVQDKETRISENSQTQMELQKKLEEALTNIALETNDIKALEEQYHTNNRDENEELRQELDDIVSNLSQYLENVKGQNVQHKQDFELLVQEKGGLEEKIKGMEAKLKILETEATNARNMQKRLTELEDSLYKTEQLNRTLRDEVNQSHQKDPELHGRLQRAENEAKQLRQFLTESEKKTENEKKEMQKQLQTEKEKVDKMTHRIQEVNRQELETKKLVSQLEAAKALNAGLRDQIEELKHGQQNEDGGFKPSDLKKRLKKFVHDFKTNKNPIEPQGNNDILGMTFYELQKHTQEKLNSSSKEMNELKKSKEKAEAEVQTLKQKLKKADAVSQNEGTDDRKHLEEENKKLWEDIKQLKKLLEEARKKNQEGAIPVRIVYKPDSDSGDRASSLDSDEKDLFDELQRELLDLKQMMRNHEDDLSRRLMDAEAEAAQWKDEASQKTKEHEAEMELQHQIAELNREKQEARIQVIAQDLDQAQFIADSLQAILSNRERALNEELGNAEMSNQMISAQEDELAKLYNILEAQRSEIEKLNQMLDYLAQQGPDNVGAAFDDELWRIRQEVNNLKETLAMQSAYIQAMPSVEHMGSQADGFYGPHSHPNVHIRTSGAAAGTQVTGFSQYSSVPPLFRRIPGSQASMGGSGPSSLTHSHGLPAGSVRTGTAQVTGAASSSETRPKSAQSVSDRHSEVDEHLGTERRESKTPPAGRTAVGKSGGGKPIQTENKIRQNAFDTNAAADRAVRWSNHQGSTTGATHTRVGPTSEPDYHPGPQHIGQPPMSYPADAPLPATFGYPVTSTQELGPPLPHQTYHPRSVASSYASQPAAKHDPSKGPSRHQKIPSPVYYPTVPDGYAGITAPPLSHQHPASSVPIGSEAGFTSRPVPAIVPGSGNAAAVTFNPIPAEINYHQNSVLPDFDDSAGRGYSLGNQTFWPSGPAQVSHYEPRRVYVPAGVGHRGKHPARIYYPARQSIPMPAPGGAPPPQPSVGHAQVIYPAPWSAAMTPVATGTPVRGRIPSAVKHGGHLIMEPPSPIRPVDVDATRGILKNVGMEQPVNDDSYLFCNVPEHHDLEDHIAELQENIRKLKIRLSKEKEFQEEYVFHEERKNIKKLLHELENRRDELEGLDLAIEQQKRNLREMKLEERDLKRDRKEALGELNYWRKKNDRKVFSRKQRAHEDSFEEELERNRQKYLKDELACLEKTLTKRQAQLRETEKNLKECKANLQDAKEQARDTVKRYDDATNSLHQVLREQQEIEKRSDDVCVELIKASENLVTLKTEVKDWEKKKIKQERLLREINNIIAKKDSEFKDLDAKVKSASQGLQRLQADLVVQSRREKDMVEALRDSEDVLAKRRAESQRIRDQIDQSRQDLEKLDQQIGRKRTELQLIQETQDRKQQDLSSILHDAESEIASKRREIQDFREEIDQLNHQKADLNDHIKTKKGELQKLKEERELEDEVLQHLMSNVNKNKSELKHTFEMQKLEETELDSVKSQHAQRLVELERTQRMLLEEKSDLEQLNAETARKTADLDRLKQAIDRDRQEVDRLNSEKQSLDDNILALSRDRDLLDKNCKAQDDILNNMKRTQRIMEEKINSTNGQLEILEGELRMKERETEQAEIQRESMQKEVQLLKQNIKESRTELKTLEEGIRQAEDHMNGIDQNVQSLFRKRDEAKLELEKLNEQIQKSSILIGEHSRQEKVKHKEMQDLQRSLADTEKEQQEAKKTLNKINREVEKEENRLKTLVNNANSDLEMVRKELSKKQEELQAMRLEYTDLQKKSEELQHNENKISELSKICRDLEQGLHDRDDEKTELAKALSASYEELQRLRKESAQIQDKMVQDQSELQNTMKDLQANLDQAKQDNLSDDKENKAVVKDVKIVLSPGRNRPLSRHRFPDYDWKKDILQERLAEEREYLKFHLQQQMLRHSETMKSVRLKSEETIDSLRWKLNNLQDVLFYNNPDVRAAAARARSRSGSPGYRIDLRHGRTRTPSPLNRSQHEDYLVQKRSRSFENLGSPSLLGREYL